jgi:TonB family protein
LEVSLVPVPSQPPPSSRIPEKSSGGGLYLVGAVLLVAAALGLYFWKRPSPTATPQAATVVVSASPPKIEEPAALYAPPPPPKLDEEDAGVDAGPPAQKSGGRAVGPGPCAGSCDGRTAGGALQSALRGRAQSAQGCYNRALRTSEVSGSMTVRVQVGPSGQVCSASLANDSVHSNEIASCVLGRFRGQTFPPPQDGCVTVDIPIAFTIKQ